MHMHLDQQKLLNGEQHAIEDCKDGKEGKMFDVQGGQQEEGFLTMVDINGCKEWPPNEPLRDPRSCHQCNYISQRVKKQINPHGNKKG